jgi:hypothetical protein
VEDPERFDRFGEKGMASNPNIEIRNPKQIQNTNAPNVQNSKKGSKVQSQIKILR